MVLILAEVDIVIALRDGVVNMWIFWILIRKAVRGRNYNIWW